ncbi:unnamed protein product [Amoebophrya sp. A25]|nr:unnamed protein product [Amoebophrya sp. A25]|eukprot:GSA25T00012764001.1
MGLVGGIAEALYNVKSLFPDDKFSLIILVTTTLEAVLLMGSLLGVFNQILVGGSSSLASNNLDYFFTIAIVGLVFYEGLPAWTGFRLWRKAVEDGAEEDEKKKMSSGNPQRDRLYQECRNQYYAMTVLFLITGVSLYLWSHQDDKPLYEHGVTDYAIEYCLDFKMYVDMAIAYYAKKCVTAVATTDLLLRAFTSAGMVRGNKESQIKVENEFGVLFDIDVKEQRATSTGR